MMAEKENVHRGKKPYTWHRLGSREWYLNLQLRGGSGAAEFKEWYTATIGLWKAGKNKISEHEKQEQASATSTDNAHQLSFDDYIDLSEGLSDKWQNLQKTP